MTCYLTCYMTCIGYSVTQRVSATGACERAGPVGLAEDDLADPDRLGRDLDALVLAAELQRLLQAEPARGHQALEHLGAGGAHVGELLLLADVDVHVLRAGVLADDHALVDLGGRVEEHHAALLQVEHGVCRGHAGAVGDQRAVLAGLDLAVPRLVALEDVVGDAGAPGVGEELGPEPDEAT